MGMRVSIARCQNSPRPMSSIRDVSMMPGQIALTRTPCCPISCAIDAVSACNPAFDAAYAAVFGTQHFARNRGDVDDRAALALFNQLATEHLTHVEGAVEVDVEHDAPEISVQVDDGHAI